MRISLADHVSTLS